MWDFRVYSIAWDGENLTAEMMYERSVAMGGGRNTLVFGFQINPPTEMDLLTVAEFQELSQFLEHLICKNLLLLAQRK